MNNHLSLTRREYLLVNGAAAALPGLAVAAEGKKREILTHAVSGEQLAQVLVPSAEWRPWPKAADRAAWEALAPAMRNGLIESATKAMAEPWKAVPATLFLEYKRIGNRSHYEHEIGLRREKLRRLVVGECVEGKGRFVDEIVNGLWLMCEETWWGYPAHLGVQRDPSGLPDAKEQVVDLFNAEAASLVAWTQYLLAPAFDRVAPVVNGRISAEINHRILQPCMERNDFGWMGMRGQRLNNWTPWICSNWLTTALLAERDEAKRRAAVMKILRVLDNFMNGYDDDGGCDEGPGYWNAAGGALFDNLEVLHSATRGGVDVYANPLVKEIGRYIYRAHIAGDYYTNFADASAIVHIDGTMVWRYGRRIGDEKMASLGAWECGRRDATDGGSLGRQLPRIFLQGEIAKAPAAETLVRDVWLPGIQVMTARRKEGSTDGLYLAAQGGHNAESHNHNDVGNFMVYAGGKPAIIDVGVETYSAKTFSSKRYEIWTMQSAYHNLPTIDGVMQGAGREFAARGVKYTPGDSAVEYALDIAAAYPKEANLKTWQRTFHYDRAAGRIDVRDQYEMTAAPKVITLTLMTPHKMVDSGGVLTLGPVKVAYDAKVFAASQEEIKITDSRLQGAWGERIYRVLLTAHNPGASAAWSLRIS